MQRATTALLERRERLAHQVITGDTAIDALRARVEEVATDALLFHAPVAGDLRAAVAAIRAAGDLERMGDLALHVAEHAQRARARARDGARRLRRDGPPRRGHGAQGRRGRAHPQRAARRRARRRRRRHGRPAPAHVRRAHGPGVGRRRARGRRPHAAGALLRALRRPRGRSWPARSCTPSPGQAPGLPLSLVSRSGPRRSPRSPSRSGWRRSSWCRPSRRGGRACRCPRC